MLHENREDVSVSLCASGAEGDTDLIIPQIQYSLLKKSKLKIRRLDVKVVSVLNYA
jgi:hypothetical protein